jgi:hypothetical protein
MRHLAIAIALVVCQLGTALGATPFDGQWKGSWSGVSNLGTGNYGCQAYIGNVNMTVANGSVSGATTGQYEGTISGTVAQNGKFKGKIGDFDISGSFSGKRFKGRFTTDKCVMSMSAKAA